MHQSISLLGAVLALLSGACAGGIGYPKIEAQLPALEDNQGRIYIYTPVRGFAHNFQPQVLVDGEAVGESRSGTFLVVDRPAGEYRVEAAKQASFAAFAGQLNSVPANIFLAAGTTAYVRIQVENDQLALRAESISEDSQSGQRNLRTLTYLGGDALSQDN